VKMPSRLLLLIFIKTISITCVCFIDSFFIVSVILVNWKGFVWIVQSTIIHFCYVFEDIHLIEGKVLFSFFFETSEHYYVVVAKYWYFLCGYYYIFDSEKSIMDVNKKVICFFADNFPQVSVQLEVSLVYSAMRSDFHLGNLGFCL
jgi:hypothetical protein